MLRAAKPAPDEEASTLSPVAGRVPLSRGKKVGIGVLGVASAAGVFWLMSQGLQPRDAAENGGRPLNAERVGEVGQGWSPMPREAPPPPPPTVQQVAAPIRPPLTSTGGFSPFAPGRGAGPSRTAIVAFELAQASQGASATSAVSGAPGGTLGALPVAAGPRDALSDRLQAGDDMETSVATMLPDRNLFITMGTPMAVITHPPCGGAGSVIRFGHAPGRA